MNNPYQLEIFYDHETGFTVFMKNAIGLIESIGTHPTDMLAAVKDAQDQLKEKSVRVFISSGDRS